MGSLYTAKYLDLNVKEWNQVSRHPAIFSSLVDNTVIEITDIDNKIHKMTFRVGGILKFEKVEGKFRVYWDDKNLV